MNGLYTKITSSGPTGPLLTKNPNGMEPQRLSPAEALTCDQNHGYTPEQQAFDNGKMDQFITYTQSASNCAAGTIAGLFATAGESDPQRAAQVAVLIEEFVRNERWDQSEAADRIAHALSLVKMQVTWHPDIFEKARLIGLDINSEADWGKPKYRESRNES